MISIHFRTNLTKAVEKISLLHLLIKEKECHNNKDVVKYLVECLVSVGETVLQTGKVNIGLMFYTIKLNIFQM